MLPRPGDRIRYRSKIIARVISVDLKRWRVTVDLPDGPREFSIKIVVVMRDKGPRAPGIIL